MTRRDLDTIQVDGARVLVFPLLQLVRVYTLPLELWRGKEKKKRGRRKEEEREKTHTHIHKEEEEEEERTHPQPSNCYLGSCWYMPSSVSGMPR